MTMPNIKCLFPLRVGLLLALPLALGCSKAPKLPTVPVSGTVTMDGQPLEGASVGFSPVNPDGTPANGTTDAQGTFRLQTYLGASFGQGDGAMPGDYIVMVTKYEAKTGSAPSADEIAAQQKAMDEARKTGKPPEPSAMLGQPKLLTPEEYSNPKKTTLKATVKDSGNQPFTFDLKKSSDDLKKSSDEEP